MEPYKETLHNLTWPELLQQISAVLIRDAKALENNVNYYKKLLGDSKADKDQINRLFEKLQLDKLRYSYFSELFFRLEESNYKFVIMNLESCIQQEAQINKRAPKDWVATVRYEAEQIKIYFMVLSYFQ